MELVQGARNKGELAKIEKFLKQFDLIAVDKKTSNKSIELMKTYSLSHGLLIPDAFIAASAIVKICHCGPSIGKIFSLLRTYYCLNTDPLRSRSHFAAIILQ